MCDQRRRRHKPQIHVSEMNKKLLNSPKKAARKSVAQLAWYRRWWAWCAWTKIKFETTEKTWLHNLFVRALFLLKTWFRRRNGQTARNVPKQVSDYLVAFHFMQATFSLSPDSIASQKKIATKVTAMKDHACRELHLSAIQKITFNVKKLLLWSKNYFYCFI